MKPNSYFLIQADTRLDKTSSLNLEKQPSRNDKNCIYKLKHVFFEEKEAIQIIALY